MNLLWGWIALALVLAAGIVWLLDRPKQPQAKLAPGQPGIFSSIFGGFMAFWSNWFRSAPTPAPAPTESAEFAALRAQIAALQQRMFNPATSVPPNSSPTAPIVVPVVGGGTTVINSQGTWTVSRDLKILLNGTHFVGGYGSRIKNIQDAIFVLGTDSNWWSWSGAGWANIGPTEPIATPMPVASPYVPVAPQSLADYARTHGVPEVEINGLLAYGATLVGQTNEQITNYYIAAITARANELAQWQIGHDNWANNYLPGTFDIRNADLSDILFLYKHGDLQLKVSPGVSMQRAIAWVGGQYTNPPPEIPKVAALAGQEIPRPWTWDESTYNGPLRALLT